MSQVYVTADVTLVTADNANCTADNGGNPGADSTLVTADSTIFTADRSAVCGEVVSITEAYTGGWYEYEWTPTRDEIRRERERLGIQPKAVKQLTRVLKKVSKQQTTPTEAVTEAKQYFADQDLVWKEAYEGMIARLSDFIAERNRIAQESYQRLLDREYAELVEHLKQQSIELQEEEDIVFMMMMLA